MFKNWCNTNHFNNASNLSHVLMDGGVLSVPFDKLNDFLEEYIRAVKAGEKLYLVEQKTKTYNFFVDIDYKDKDPLSVEEIKDISKIVCDKVKRHGGGECLISVSPPKKAGTQIKTGIHLNWPGMVVDQSSAVALREHIVVALTKGKGSKNWDQIVDSSVYGDLKRGTKGSGFRMPWSYKLAKHDDCGGSGCSGCKNGKIEQLSYLPLFKYTTSPLSTLIRVDQKPDVNILKMSVVRTDQPQSVIISSPNVSATRQEGSFTEEQMKDEIEDEEVRELIQTFVQNNMEGQERAYVTKIFKHKEIYLVKTTSKYCENIKREHNSNHVWFMISGTEIIQKCFCECPTLSGRRDGFCKDFRGRRHKLSTKIIEKLNLRNTFSGTKPTPSKNIQTENVKMLLGKFLIKNMHCQDTTKIVSISPLKKGWNVLTTSNYCETIHGVHDNVDMSYFIEKGTICQKCPLCKRSTARKHVLYPSIINLLKQK